MADQSLRELGSPRAPRGRAALDGLRDALAPRRLAGAARTHRRRRHRTARRPAGPPVPAAAAPPAARVLAGRGPGRRARCGSAPHAAGIWAPECGYAPGMEHGYAAAGVAALPRRRPRAARRHRARPAGRATRTSSRSAATWRSATGCGPRSPGYPGRAAYRDFHTYDHDTGLKPSRVTGRTVDSERQGALRPGARRRRRSTSTSRTSSRPSATGSASENDAHGRPALVVAAFDTELFGHWWYEGPQWLEKVLRALPEAGVGVGTLRRRARRRATSATRWSWPTRSWGRGKDWRVWAGDQVADLVRLNDEVVADRLDTVDKASGRRARPADVPDCATAQRPVCARR